MGVRMPETCLAIFKRQVINLRSCCILLVDSVESMMMHGPENPKHGGLFYLSLDEGITSPGEQPFAQQRNRQLWDRFRAICHTNPGTMILHVGVLRRGAQNPQTILVG